MRYWKPLRQAQCDHSLKFQFQNITETISPPWEGLGGGFYKVPVCLVSHHFL